MPKISFILNDEHLEVEIEPGETLLELIRDRLGFTGTKRGCEVGECGACTVLIDDIPIDSCLYLAAWVAGKKVTTIEGIAEGNKLSKLQQSFIDEGAIQCGYCTPGVLLTSHALLKKIEKPTVTEIKRELAGNMCRCAGYQNIIRAVQKACE